MNATAPTNLFQPIVTATAREANYLVLLPTFLFVAANEGSDKYIQAKDDFDDDQVCVKAEGGSGVATIVLEESRRSTKPKQQNKTTKTKTGTNSQRKPPLRCWKVQALSQRGRGFVRISKTAFIQSSLPICLNAK